MILSINNVTYPMFEIFIVYLPSSTLFNSKNPFSSLPVFLLNSVISITALGIGFCENLSAIFPVNIPVFCENEF